VISQNDKIFFLNKITLQLQWGVVSLNNCSFLPWVKSYLNNFVSGSNYSVTKNTNQNDIYEFPFRNDSIIKKSGLLFEKRNNYIL
jgi:hypothetical protein